MDQMPQEIIHSLFSIDPNVDTRGHLYPYNYPYGQYPYPYPYPYGAPHPSSSLPPPPPSIPSSAHSVTQSPQNLPVPQGNLSSFSVGIHGIRPSVGDGREHTGSMNAQGAENLRNLPADARNMGNSRYPIDMRPVSVDQRYVDDPRSMPHHPRSSMGSANVGDCPQPTDLTTQSVDARLYNNVRHAPGEMKESSSVKRMDNPCGDSLLEDQKPLIENSHPNVAKSNLGHMAEDYSYSGDMRSYNSSHGSLPKPEGMMQQHLPSGDPRSSSSVQNQGMPIPMQEPKTSMASQGAGVCPRYNETQF